MDNQYLLKEKTNKTLELIQRSTLLHTHDLIDHLKTFMKSYCQNLEIL